MSKVDLARRATIDARAGWRLPARSLLRPDCRCYVCAMGSPNPADGPDRDAPPSLDQAFFETDDPELRAFADKQTGRKLALLLGTLTVILASGVGLCWAIYHAVR